MAHQAAASSSSSHQGGCPPIEHSEYSIWDYRYEAPVSAPANETLESAKHLFSIGQEFDALWDFEDGTEGLNMMADVAAAETETVEDIPTVTIVEEHKASKRLWNFEMISKYFHMPMNQAAKELKIKEAILKKICLKVGIDQWPYRKLRSLEHRARKIQGNPDHTEMINELDMQREQILKDHTVESGIEIDKLRVSCSKKRKYRSLTELSYSAPLVSSSYVSVVPLPQTEEEQVLPSCT